MFLVLALNIKVFQINRSTHQRCSVKKGVLRNFTKFTGKRLCQSLFFNKIAGIGHFFNKLQAQVADSGIGVFLWILRNFLGHLFYRTPPDDCFWINQHKALVNKSFKRFTDLNVFRTWKRQKNIVLKHLKKSINHIQGGPFQDCSRVGGKNPKIWDTYSTMMKLSTVILYVTKIKKNNKSVKWYTHWVLLTSAFFYWKSGTFLD